MVLIVTGSSSVKYGLLHQLIDRHSDPNNYFANSEKIFAQYFCEP